MSVPEERLSRDLYDEVKAVSDMMFALRRVEEADWLWMALLTPQCCHSLSARKALQRSRSLIGEFGYPRVAEWVSTVVGEGS